LTGGGYGLQQLVTANEVAPALTCESI
jgi:hypothetical protein